MTLISAFLLWLVKDCLFLLGYISGHQNFKRPLSPAQEQEALLEMKAGSDEARQRLIEHNLRLVVHVARKYKVPGCTFDDLISIGAVGLIKAIRTFNMNTGTSLSTYAARCIENEVLMCLRQSRKQQADISLNEPLGTDSDGNAVSFVDILGTSPDIVEDEVRRRITLSKIREILPTLPERERLVLKMRYGLLDGRAHPQHEIAELLGISRSYVSRVEKHAIELLKDALME
ncbi:MAG: RNA polymerase sporulation sigma factor SigK [Clostridiales bacterium]|nr:RNA polymerase sporulation sigma factor SigK [Clostridiales bacterium]